MGCSLTSSSSSSSSSSGSSNHSSSSTLSDFSTPSSMNLLDESTSSSSTRTATTRELSAQRNVRFSPHLAVRTYSLVLGDHPLGSHGLAIEHGWDYDSHDGKKVEMHLHESCRQNANWSRQRSHLDKKRLLMEVAGCSMEELNARTHIHQQQRGQISR